MRRGGESVRSETTPSVKVRCDRERPWCALGGIVGVGGSTGEGEGEAYDDSEVLEVPAICTGDVVGIED